MARAILFDLGNTLVEYYTRDEFPAILSKATARVKAELRASAAAARPYLREDKDGGSRGARLQGPALGGAIIKDL
ncbi:hypothetical protein MUO93_06055, partial [Candidatus Bathyarchaeota archaeon]|nr:hypothetical protein [Candidatus Bathyarchaeota archaeon]